MKKSFMTSLLIGCLAGTAWSVTSEVVPDWAKLKLKTKATTKPAKPEDDWKTTELAAWQEGYKSIESHYQTYLPEMSKQALRDLVRSKTNSSNTTYYADGSVSVEFEAALPEVATADTQQLSKSQEETSARHTGLILNVSGSVKPKVAYRVLSAETGEVLFALQRVSEAGFKENSTGRWFAASAQNSYRKFVGEQPVELSLTSNGQDLIVEKAAWSQAITGNESLLRTAKIAIVYGR